MAEAGGVVKLLAQPGQILLPFDNGLRVAGIVISFVLLHQPGDRPNRKRTVMNGDA